MIDIPRPHVSPDSPAAAVVAAYEAVLAICPAPDASLADWLALKTPWENATALASGSGLRLQRAYYRNLHDMDAAAAWKGWQAEMESFIDASTAHLRASVLTSPHRVALEAAWGTWWFTRLEMAARARDPKLAELRKAEATLVARHDALMGDLVPTAEGDRTHAEIQALFGDALPARRRQGWEARSAYLGARRDALHDVFGGLLSTRQAMAERVGLATYTPIAFAERGRSGYGPAETARFRDAVKEHIVPLCRSLRAELAPPGRSTIPGWDLWYTDGAYSGGTAPEDLMGVAIALLERLDPALGEHAAALARANAIDWENRPGKLSMPFAAYFPDTGVVEVSVSATGSDEQLLDLVHELGHAIAYRESHAHVGPVMLRQPTFDVVEVPSTALELLVLDVLDDVLDPVRARWLRRRRLFDGLQRMTSWVAHDEFQAWAYAHPTHGPAEREATWLAIWDTLIVGVDRDGDRTLERLWWSRMKHLFAWPGYGIEYAFAEVAALALRGQAVRDRSQALAGYLRLCRLGGSQPMPATFAIAGLPNPLEPASVAEAAKTLAQALSEAN